MTKLREAVAATVLAAALWTAGAPTAGAGIEDYEFQLVEDAVRQGEALIAARLVDRRSGRAVPDAVIFARRIDMAPDGMPAMTAPLEAAAAAEPGVYRFRTNLAMAGNWRLSLATKVQGETGTLESRLNLRAVP